MKRKYYIFLALSIFVLFLAFCLLILKKQSVQPESTPPAIVAADPYAKSPVERLPSVNGAYEALSISSETTQIYADKQVNFIPSSNNIWLFEKETEDYTQITEHRDYVSRENLFWTNDNRLIFTEGDSTVTEYNPMLKKKKTLLGPESPMGTCVDACSYGVTFIISPNKQYYIKFFSGLNEAKNAIEWVNIQTGATGKVTGQYSFLTDEIDFTAENQFTVPSRTEQDSGIYGDPDIGPQETITVVMK